MSTIQDHDLRKESVQLQEFADEVRQLINTGSIEIEVTTASSPAFAAPQETKMVMSFFGAQYRLYMSYLGEWYYVTFAKL